MAFFKSADEKASEQEKREKKLLQKYGLDTITDPNDLESIKKIANELLGTGFGEAGLKIGMAKPEVTVPISYQRAIVEQNFIIIRQLDRIAKLLDR